MSDPQSGQSVVAPKWTPLGRIERRVLGVLVEKAKTTPDAYPMTLNGLTTGCNQKSNRDPLMNLEPDQVETALEKLRHLQAVIEVSGGGRVPKFRHLMYEWMGVDKVEAAVMTELLLRGTQTVGELRGRAARMESIADVGALQPVLQSLIDRKLVLSLTPAGRGQIVTHGLYLPEEMDKVRQSASAYAVAAAGRSEDGPAPPPAARPAPSHHSAPSAPTPLGTSASTGAPSAGSYASQEEFETLKTEVAQLKSEVARLKTDLQDLWSSLN